MIPNCKDTNEIDNTLIMNLLNIFYPVGCYFGTSNPDFDPNINWGEWIKNEDEACFLVAASENNSDYLLGKTGGNETVVLTTDNLPSHNHTLNNSSFRY